MRKDSKGKIRPTLVDPKFILELAKVREFGYQKYKSDFSWKENKPEEYRDALMRHALAYIDNPNGVDEESGLSHLIHLSCVAMFLRAFERDQQRNSVPINRH